MKLFHPVEWRGGKVRFLDQTRLPLEECFLETDDYQVIAKAIKLLAIRGAPLIGIAAGYGVALGAQNLPDGDPTVFHNQLDKIINVFASTRPTAVNLFWALHRLRALVDHNRSLPVEQIKELLIREAITIHEEDALTCEEIGKNGAACLPNAAVVLTHCNTGRLATGGIGTAQGIIVKAWEQRKLKHVYIDETRPLLQGARLTAWELEKQGIPCTLITDNTAGFLMQRGMINAIVVGADRITRSGDIANKVGTYALAVLAKHHDIPLYVAAPRSTIDLDMASGREIPIEERSSKEVTEIAGSRVAPEGIDVYSPAFDITPADLVSAIITESGIIRPPFHIALMQLEAKARIRT